MYLWSSLYAVTRRGTPTVLQRGESQMSEARAAGRSCDNLHVIGIRCEGEAVSEELGYFRFWWKSRGFILSLLVAVWNGDEWPLAVCFLRWFL